MKIRKFFAILLVAALALSSASLAWAAHKATVEQQNLYAALGNSLEICSANGSHHVDFADFATLIDLLAAQKATAKNWHENGKDTAFLQAEFAQNYAKFFAVSQSFGQQKFALKLFVADAQSRAPPALAA